MATKQVCDGCGDESPDARGLYVANHWVNVTARVPFAFAGKWESVRELLLCRPCARKCVEALQDEGERKYLGEMLATKQDA